MSADFFPKKPDIGRKENPMRIDTDYFPHFEIGTTPKGERCWTNLAVDHVNGRITNESLMRMSDDQLRFLSVKGNAVVQEVYIRPTNIDVSKKQDVEGYPGQKYWGACRAYLILEFRNKCRNEKEDSRDYAISKQAESLDEMFAGPNVSESLMESSGAVESAAMSKESSYRAMLTGLKSFCDDHPNAMKAKELLDSKIVKYEKVFNRPFSALS